MSKRSSQTPRDARGLTVRQGDILAFLMSYTEQNGTAPSIRRIGEEFEIGSLRGVTVHLDALERKGFIKRSSEAHGVRVEVAPSGNRVTLQYREELA
jgi:SOS-response transcriptional repressor LexA